MSVFHKRSSNGKEKKNVEMQRGSILGERTDFYVKEAYKALRTNVIFSIPADGCRRICVTSSTAGEGKSITTLNLAISFAEAGRHVLLIDADLRRPNQSRLLNESATPGLSTILAGLCPLEETVHKGIRSHLDVIFSGEVPPNPSELLGHERMRALLDTLSSQYDYILIDTPPVNVVTDACVLSNVLDGVLFVVRNDYAESDAVLAAVKQLELAGAKLLGFILNGIDSSTEKYGYGKYKNYGYKYTYAGEMQKQKSIHTKGQTEKTAVQNSDTGKSNMK